MKLGSQHNRDRGLVQILDVERRTNRTDETSRTADVDGIADFGAYYSELIVIIMFNAARYFRIRPLRTAASFNAEQTISSPTWGAMRFGALAPTPISG